MKIIEISSLWCPSCIIMNNKLADILSGLDVIKYDYDMDEEIIKDFNPGKVLPVFIFFKNDKETGRLVGEKSKEEFLEMFNR